MLNLLNACARCFNDSVIYFIRMCIDAADAFSCVIMDILQMIHFYEILLN
jgi:hypothetical protein